MLLQAQQRARRGPTPEVFFAKHLDNTRLVKAADPVRVKEMRRFAIAMSLLFAMVMLYGWQHFSSIESAIVWKRRSSSCSSSRSRTGNLGLTEAQLCDLTGWTAKRGRWAWMRRSPGRWFGRRADWIRHPVMAQRR